MWSIRDRMVFLGTLWLAFPGLVGCASDALQTADSSSAAPKLICTSERPTGSHLPVRVCRTQAQIDQDKADADETYRDLRIHEAPPMDHSH